MKPEGRTLAACSLLFAALLFSALPAVPDGKKLQVVQDGAVVHLDASEHSPAVETLGRGAVLSLASAVKTKFNWFYVYFTSLESGNTRSGYIHESCVRKLYPELRVIEIASGDEVLNPPELEIDPSFQPSMAWGTSRSTILRTEGRPQSLDVSDGREVLIYQKNFMNKRCRVEYVLEGGRLVSARLHLLENYADKARYIEDYNRVREFLTARVGAPRADRAVWQDHSYERLNDCWGIALSQGHVEFLSEWVFSDTEVRLTLAGANNHVALAAELSDVKSRKPNP